MISSEVQRTLVKSPPELWAEISDPDSLARHLGDFGEIRITRVQPEQKVEWETDDASGTVVIKPSGWGTKVKLTVTRELAQPEPATEGSATADDEPDDEQLSAHVPEQAADEPARDIELESPSEPGAHSESNDEQTELLEEAETYAEAEAVAEAEPEAEPVADAEPVAQPEPEPRRGLFARLFGRRRPRTEEPSAVELAEPAPQLTASEPVELTDDEPRPEMPAAEQTIETREDSADRSEQQVAPDDASSREKLAEELAAEEVTAVLTGVLDRLGAAHHRPFSRA